MNRQMGEQVSAVASGAKEPGAIEAVRLDWIKKEFDAKADMLRGILVSKIKDARPHVCDILEDAIKAVNAYAEKQESDDLAACEKLGIDFEPSAPSRYARSVAQFIERVSPKREYHIGEGVPLPRSSLFFLSGYSE
jgi:hypothetical protein